MSVSNSEGDQWLAQEFTRQIVAAVSEAKGSELLDLLVRTITATVQAEVRRFDAQATATSQVQTETLAKIQETLAGRLQSLERALGGQAQTINALLPFLEHTVQQIKDLDVKQTQQADAASDEVIARLQPELYRLSAALLELQNSDGRAPSPRTISVTAADIEKISGRVSELVVQGFDERYRQEQTASRVSQAPTSKRSRKGEVAASNLNEDTKPPATSDRHSLLGGSSRWASFGIVALLSFALGWGVHSGTSRMKGEPDEQKPTAVAAHSEKQKQPPAVAAPGQKPQDQQADSRGPQKREEAAAPAVPPLGTAAAIDDAIRRLADTSFMGTTCIVAIEPRTVRTCLVPNAAASEHATESAANLRKYLAGSETQEQRRRLAIALFQALSLTLGDGQVKVDGQWGAKTKAAIDGIECAKTSEHTQLLKNSDAAAFGRAIEAVLLNCADSVLKR